MPVSVSGWSAPKRPWPRSTGFLEVVNFLARSARRAGRASPRRGVVQGDEGCPGGLRAEVFFPDACEGPSSNRRGGLRNTARGSVSVGQVVHGRGCGRVVPVGPCAAPAWFRKAGWLPSRCRVPPATRPGCFACSRWRGRPAGTPSAASPAPLAIALRPRPASPSSRKVTPRSSRTTASARGRPRNARDFSRRRH